MKLNILICTFIFTSCDDTNQIKSDQRYESPDQLLLPKNQITPNEIFTQTLESGN